MKELIRAQMKREGGASLIELTLFVATFVIPIGMILWVLVIPSDSESTNETQQKPAKAQKQQEERYYLGG